MVLTYLNIVMKIVKELRQSIMLLVPLLN